MKKERLFMLASGKKPVAYSIRHQHKQVSPLLYNDVENNKVRELRYATNMSSPFVDEQEGIPTLAHIWFRDGLLSVSANNIALLNFLEVHPDNKANGGRVFYEYDPDKDALDEVQSLEAAAEAMSMAKDIDIDDASAIVFNQVGRRISQYSSSEIKRDLLSLALNSPQQLIDMMNDEQLKLDWIAHQAFIYQIVSMKGSQVKIGKSTKSLLTVKPGETGEYALSRFFLTDDGIAALEEIKTRLNKLLK